MQLCYSISYYSIKIQADTHHHRLQWLVVGFKANCSLVGPGPIDGMPLLGYFLRDLSPYLREFRRKPWKTPNGQVDKRDSD